MNVEIRDGVMIVTHSTGVVNVYGIVHVQQHRDILQGQATELQDEILTTDGYLVSMKASQAPSILKRIINRVRRKKE